MLQNKKKLFIIYYITLTQNYEKEQLSELYLFIIKLIITTIFIFLLISIVLLSTRSHINSRLDKFESRINVTYFEF